MRRRPMFVAAFGAAALALGGCSTRPCADVADFFKPARGACSRTSNANGAAPGCARAMAEDQNYRPNPLDFFRYRRNKPVAVPATVPEIR